MIMFYKSFFYVSSNEIRTNLIDRYIFNIASREYKQYRCFPSLSAAYASKVCYDHGNSNP